MVWEKNYMVKRLLQVKSNLQLVTWVEKNEKFLKNKKC
jgi:hypothetical protein